MNIELICTKVLYEKTFIFTGRMCTFVHIYVSLQQKADFPLKIIYFVINRAVKITVNYLKSYIKNIIK